MPTALLCVRGMRDQRDEHRVEQALVAEAGVFGAVANHEESCAEIDYEDDEVTIDRLLEIVRSAGFDGELHG